MYIIDILNSGKSYKRGEYMKFAAINFKHDPAFVSLKLGDEFDTSGNITFEFRDCNR